MHPHHAEGDKITTRNVNIDIHEVLILKRGMLTIVEIEKH